MADDPKSDIQRAQAVLRRAYTKVALMPEVQADPFLFPALVFAALSAVTAELAAQGQTLMEPDGIQKVIDFQVEQLTKYLREDLTDARNHIIAQSKGATKQ